VFVRWQISILSRAPRESSVTRSRGIQWHRDRHYSDHHLWSAVGAAAPAARLPRRLRAVSTIAAGFQCGGPHHARADTSRTARRRPPNVFSASRGRAKVVGKPREIGDRSRRPVGASSGRAVSAPRTMTASSASAGSSNRTCAERHRNCTVTEVGEFNVGPSYGMGCYPARLRAHRPAVQTKTPARDRMKRATNHGQAMRSIFGRSRSPISGSPPAPADAVTKSRIRSVKDTTIV